MALSREEVLEITRYMLAVLGQLDPAARSVALEMTPPTEEPRRFLLDVLHTLVKFYSERSAGAYPAILDRVNHFVRTGDGNLIRGIAVRLDERERELYGTDEFTFAEHPDRSDLISDLRRLISIITVATEAEV